MKVTGRRIDIDPNIVEEYSYNSDGGWSKAKNLSSVITITVDGKQLISCGDTCIFYENGLTPDYEFYLDNIASKSGGLLETTLIAGKVNEIKNKFGKSMVVIIKSQTGAPIYAFSGNRVYWEIPEDLPKFTKLMIDDVHCDIPPIRGMSWSCARLPRRTRLLQQSLPRGETAGGRQH